MVGLTLEFGGGLELLFGGEKVHKVEVPTKAPEQELDLGGLLVWVRDHLLQERPEMFIKDKSVRPGILVLINDTDWELCGKLESPLANGDTVVFISTLHGG